jgi:hypothetical protein
MISILLTTLYAQQPTLAALAYLSKVRMHEGASTSANPASINCTSLGGTSTFGPISAAGGGWPTANPDDTYHIISECVFADGSMLDEWGILYYANDVVRGTDLSEKLRYQPAELPAIYMTTVTASNSGTTAATPAAVGDASGTYVSSVYPAADASGLVEVLALYENGNVEQTTIYLGKGNVVEVGTWRTEADETVTVTLTGTSEQSYEQPAVTTYTRESDMLVDGVFKLMKLPVVTPEEMNAATSSN